MSPNTLNNIYLDNCHTIPGALIDVSQTIPGAFFSVIIQLLDFLCFDIDFVFTTLEHILHGNYICLFVVVVVVVVVVAVVGRCLSPPPSPCTALLACPVM